MLNGPMRTMHYPKPYFNENPFADPKGKLGPTYVRPKDSKKEFRPPGVLIPTGPAKWVCINISQFEIIIRIFCLFTTED